MPISREKIESLLFEDESSTLDFKREQYPFSDADDFQKAELLKDILAFSNAWRRTDAYILIGVKEVKGGKSEVVGVSHHLDDANLQQFVNQKTQRPVVFSYETIEIENKQIGIIHIPLQNRPIFLKKKYAKLGKNAVYIRRGSSTDEANPDEIKKMGENSGIPVETIPIIELQFGRAFERSLHGESVELKTTVLTVPTKKQIDDGVEDAQRRQSSESGSLFLNSYGIEWIVYFRELAEYLKEAAFFEGIHLVISNTSSTIAKDVQIEMEVKDSNRVFCFKDECSLSKRPNKPFPISITSFNQNQKVPSFCVERSLGSWHISTSFQKVLPKQTLWTDNGLFLGAAESTRLSIPVKTFAANLPQPIKFELTIDIEVSKKVLTLKELFKNKT